ncbi:hypothetical protein Q8G35_25815 [Peribacillus simplex]|uniref:Uncharacterized protein n=2 Tax=Peribacillus TaxID=2675229 RepID=A0AA90P6K6_9BACI|nr:MULTISPECIES: hypothetical protein [Peribacillus]MDP1421689.1 hypothetical protein [Peribacillus simplex]MDP1454387.1 hypothetical protein [Peribacillus frigoritolerans]
MDSFLSLIIFIFPGLIAFFWIQLFGFTPAVRYQGTEMLAISAILWIPINIVVLLIYYFITVMYKYNVYYPIDMPNIKNFSDLNRLSTNFVFILYYVIASVFTSYFLARAISGKFFDVMLEKVNTIRIKNNKAALSRDASVWDTVFSKDVAQVVKIINLEDKNMFDIGEIKNVSRTYETEKNIVLQRMTLWREIDEKYDLDVSEVFFDIKTGMKIIIYDSTHCQVTLDDYRRKQEEGNN